MRPVKKISDLSLIDEFYVCIQHRENCQEPGGGLAPLNGVNPHPKMQKKLHKKVKDKTEI